MVVVPSADMVVVSKVMPIMFSLVTGSRLSVIWTVMEVPSTTTGGLGSGGGGQVRRDLLIHLRDGQAIGTDLITVDLQLNGGVAVAQAGGGVGKASRCC